MNTEEPPASRAFRLSASFAATLPAYGIVALGLWRYAVLAVLIAGVSLIGWGARRAGFLGSYLVLAAVIGALANWLGLEMQQIALGAFPVWLGGVLLVLWLDTPEVRSR